MQFPFRKIIEIDRHDSKVMCLYMLKLDSTTHEGPVMK
jgi:hypothetical protein